MQTSFPLTPFFALLLLTLSFPSCILSTADVTTLTAEEVVDCLKRDATLSLSSPHVIIHHHYVAAGSSSSSSRGDKSRDVHTCTINVTTTSDKVFRVLTGHHDLCKDPSQRKDSGQQGSVRVVRGDREVVSSCGVPPRFFCLSQRVSVVLHMDVLRDVVLEMNLTAVSSQLSLLTSTPNSWTRYVDTPGLSEEVAYPAGPEQWARLTVPEGHVLMASFLHLLLREVPSQAAQDSLTLYVDGESEQHVVWTASGAGPPPVSVLQASKAAVAFKTTRHPSLWNVTSSYTWGFRLLLTFHAEDERPEKDGEGVYWNCSVPFWSKFQSHLYCNLERECLNGEDESQCWYTTSKCSPDKVTVGDNCYMLLPPSSPTSSLSWNQARKQCSSQGGRLASLNTPTEWQDVVEAIQGRRSPNVFIGLHYNRYHLPSMYQSLWYWTDGTTALYIHRLHRRTGAYCSFFSRARAGLDTVVCHQELNSTSYLCEIPPTKSARNISGIALSLPINITRQFMARHPDKYSLCPDTHLTQIYLQPECHKQEPEENQMHKPEDQVSSHPVSSHPVSPHPVYYTCVDEQLRIPYSFVCDHRPHCQDLSDEKFCVVPECEERGTSNYRCSNGQCIPVEQRCDDIHQCFDLTDETGCHYISTAGDVMMTSHAGSVMMDKAGELQVVARAEPDCPHHTHFQCQLHSSFCLPVYLRCNGVRDCPGGEDEADCQAPCPGFYRCHGSAVCLHPHHLCDAIVQCPQWEDELFCDVTCPHNCSCFGLEVICGRPFPAWQHPDIRYLDAGGSGMRVANLTENGMLVYLRLAHNQLRGLQGANFSNLLHLDLSHNRITQLRAAELLALPNLRHLNLSANPLRGFLLSQPTPALSSLQVLDLSHIVLTSLNGTIFDMLGMTGLHTLILTRSALQKITGRGFKPLRQLRVLLLDGCPLKTFPYDLLRGLYHLQLVMADNYRICCTHVLPEHSEDKHYRCVAPFNEMSSCGSLLRENVYRFCLYIAAILALICNIGSFIYRLCSKDGGGQDHSCHVFVSYLCLSDALMGVYLVIIGAADQIYKDLYVWREEEWRGSVGCTVAGVVSLLSSEISVMLIFLITVDRLLALRHPLSRLLFTHRSAHAMSILTWIFGVAVAAYPLLAHWNFYNQTGICIPLPITRNIYIAHYYAFAIIIVFNLTVFLFIAASQALIYRTLRRLARDVTEPESDATAAPPKVDLSITRRLVAIAMTDFLCWFPISILGIAAGMGVAVPGEVRVAVTVFLLPINSILNPFIYTLSLLGQRRQARRRREEMEEEEEEEEEEEGEEGYVMTQVASSSVSSSVAVVSLPEVLN